MDWDTLAEDVLGQLEEDYGISDATIIEADDEGASFVVEGTPVSIEWGDTEDDGQYDLQRLAKELYEEL